MKRALNCNRQVRIDFGTLDLGIKLSDIYIYTEMQNPPEVDRLLVTEGTYEDFFKDNILSTPGWPYIQPSAVLPRYRAVPR